MKVDKNLIKKYLIFSLGLLVFGTGIAFSNKSLFGGNPMAVLVGGMSKHLPLSFGTCNLIAGIIEVIVGYVCDKKNVTFATFFGLFCGSYSIDLASLFIPTSDNIYTRFIYMIVGVLLYTLGIAIQQLGKIGYSNLDCFIFGLGKKFKIHEYHSIRWIVDCSFVAIGYFLGGVVGFGTLVLLLFSGVFVEFYLDLLKRIFK